MVSFGERRRGASVVLVCALRALGPAAALLIASPAAAQSSSDQAAAEALFKQGRDLMAAGQYAEACPKLAESQRLDPAPGTLLNLATCYERNGQVASAWVTFKEAATAARKADQTERARLAKDKAAELEPLLSTLTIVVAQTANHPDLQVRRDGELVGRAEWGAAIPVDPGLHVVEARAPGRKLWQGQATIAGVGTKTSLEVPPLEPSTETQTLAEGVSGASVPPNARVSGSSREEPAPIAHPGATQRTWAWVTGSVGLAGVAAGAVLGSVALAANNGAAANDCVDTVCTSHGVSSTHDAKHTAMGSNIAFAVGGGLMAMGLVLWVTAPADTPSSAVAVGIAPLAGVGMGGALVRGGF